MKNALIFIGVPCLDTIKTETTTSLMNMAAVCKYPAKLNVHKSCYVHVARNAIVKEALENGASHVMFIDSDMQFPGDSINTLMDHDKDIVGGLYFRRQPPHWPTVMRIEDKKMMVVTNPPADKLFQVDVAATGFLLIKTEVFKKIEPPYFYFNQFHGKYVGEDTYFCVKARKNNIKIWIDPTIPLGHVGEYVYSRNDFEAYVEYRKKQGKKVTDEFDGSL